MAGGMFNWMLEKRLLDNWLQDKMNHKGYWCEVVLVDKWCRMNFVAKKTTTKKH